MAQLLWKIVWYGLQKLNKALSKRNENIIPTQRPVCDFIYTLITFGVPNPPTTKENIKTSMASGEKGWLEPTVITRGKKKTGKENEWKGNRVNIVYHIK